MVDFTGEKRSRTRTSINDSKHYPA